MNLISFVSDGANVMSGQENGLIAKVRQLVQPNKIIGVWCLAHRLQIVL